MKLLWLSNSDDVAGDVPVEARAYSRVGGMVGKSLGEQVEVVARVIWPAPGLADLIDTWIKRYEPDAVIFHINGFWYLYRSPPLRLQRRLGRLGRPVITASLRLAGTWWFAKTRLFHGTRWLALHTIGGDTYFAPEAVAEMVEACVQRIIQHEHVALVVRGQMAPWSWNSQPPGALRYVHRRIAAFCAGLHVAYVAVDPDATDAERINFWRGGDRLHTSETGHNWYAELDAGAIIAAVREQRGGTA